MALGKRVAALVIARGKSDGTDAKWTGSVPGGPGKWTGTNPILPMAGAWKYSGGAWQKVELPRPLQEAIDDAAYAREALLMPKEHAIERDHSGEHSVVALTTEGDLTPPAERVRFKEGCEGGWDDVMQKVPGALVREGGTVLEWYRLKRFPTPQECAAL